jgi:uncharacterized cupin superfamily protein/glyoxylase-like metal-dependent hydrolase (beta-lactamase superfamily II)
MQKTVVDGLSMWSVWQPGPNVFFNSFFVEAGGGNLIVDPLPLSEPDAAQIDERGGAAWVVVTNRDHERDAKNVAARFGAKIAASEADAPLLGIPVDRTLKEGDELGGGRVLTFEGLKTAGEIALQFRAKKAAIAGDALWGDVAGKLRLGPKLADAERAALSLRRLAAVRPEHLLIGDGQCIFSDATRVIWQCLEACEGVYVNKINVDEAEWKHDPPGTREPYVGSWTDIDFEIGAEQLGYRVARIPAGKAFCPTHWHTAEEEVFIVTEGEPTLVTPRGTWKLRKGDFVAFPARASGAHKIVNESNVPCDVIMIANVEPNDSCFYPDSKKVLIERAGLILRDHPALDYFDGE